MHTTTAAVDLAKNVFQVALTDGSFRVIEQHRLSRSQFEQFFANRNVDRVVMEACGSAHHFARQFRALGMEAVLLPAQYIRAYVRRNKTDAADAAAVARAQGKELAGIRRWAMDLQQRANHNKATCALANKLARIAFAVLRDHTTFGQPPTRQVKKLNRLSFELAH